MRKLYIPFAFSILVLSSCYSTLTVRVHSFDMHKMRESKEYDKESRVEQLKIYQSLLQGSIFNDVEDQMLNMVKKGLDVLVDNSLFASTSVDPTMKILSPKINGQLSKYKSSMTKVSNSLQISLLSKDMVAEQTYLDDYAKFLNAKEELQNFANSLGTEIGEPDLNNELVILFKKYTDLAVLTSNTTYGTAIADDNMASFIAKAPEDYWNKYKTTFYTDGNDLSKSKKNSSINVTRITSFIGNSDIAVKMDGPGNFIIKGVRLDADQAFRTSFKVLSQGIKYLTYASGIPLPGSTGANTTAQARIPEIANLDRNRLQSEELNTQYQQLTDSFLKIIDSYKDELNSSNDSKRLAAVVAVKKAYLYYKSQLPIQNP